MESSALLGEAGIVEFFVSVLSANDVSDEVVIQALHILGDSCEKTGKGSQIEGQRKGNLSW